MTKRNSVDLQDLAGRSRRPKAGGYIPLVVVGMMLLLCWSCSTTWLRSDKLLGQEQHEMRGYSDFVLGMSFDDFKQIAPSETKDGQYRILNNMRILGEQWSPGYIFDGDGRLVEIRGDIPSGIEYYGVLQQMQSHYGIDYDQRMRVIQEMGCMSAIEKLRKRATAPWSTVSDDFNWYFDEHDSIILPEQPISAAKSVVSLRSFFDPTGKGPDTFQLTISLLPAHRYDGHKSVVEQSKAVRMPDASVVTERSLQAGADDGDSGSLQTESDSRVDENLKSPELSNVVNREDSRTSSKDKEQSLSLSPVEKQAKALHWAVVDNIRSGDNWLKLNDIKYARMFYKSALEIDPACEEARLKLEALPSTQ